eukprot:2374169-Alexandrium_andersonii.AAC.1
MLCCWCVAQAATRWITRDKKGLCSLWMQLRDRVPSECLGVDGGRCTAAIAVSCGRLVWARRRKQERRWRAAAGLLPCSTASRRGREKNGAIAWCSLIRHSFGGLLAWYLGWELAWVGLAGILAGPGF